MRLLLLLALTGHDQPAPPAIPDQPPVIAPPLAFAPSPVRQVTFEPHPRHVVAPSPRVTIVRVPPPTVVRGPKISDTGRDTIFEMLRKSIR